MASELRERVFSVVRDTSRQFITEQDVDIWTQEGIEDLSSRLSLLQGTTSGTTSGNTITIPAAYVDLIDLTLGGEEVTFDVDNTTWNTIVFNADSQDVTMGRVFNGNFELYPTPDTGTAYVLRYWSGSSTSTDNFTGSLKAKVVKYAQAMVKYKENDFAAGDRYMAMYEADLPAPNLESKNHPVGPMTVTYEPSIWDIEGRHV